MVERDDAEVLAESFVRTEPVEIGGGSPAVEQQQGGRIGTRSREFANERGAATR
jgi:hypothetical protein